MKRDSISSSSCLLFMFCIVFIIFSCATEKVDFKRYSQSELLTMYDQLEGSYVDPRDSQIYKWKVLRDGQKWMMENMRYETIFSHCIDDDEELCLENGRLYQYKFAKLACPTGWKIPSFDEWQTFLNTTKGYTIQTGQKNWKRLGNYGVSIRDFWHWNKKTRFFTHTGYIRADGVNAKGRTTSLWSDSKSSDSNSIYALFYKLRSPSQLTLKYCK